MSTNSPTQAPVAGVVFNRSTFHAVCMILFCVILFYFVAGMIAIRIVRHPDKMDPIQLQLWGTFFGLVLVVGSVIVVYYAIRKFWVMQRLIIGSDRLQIIETKRKDDVVVLQIPFANMASFQYETTPTRRHVGIDLSNVSDPDTFARNEDFEANRKANGRHFIIATGYNESLTEILGELEQAVGKWKNIRKA